MSGTYLVEVHACELPEIKPKHGQGTVWQCECEKLFVMSWHSSIYNIPSGYSWRPIDPAYWDAELLCEKPRQINFNYPLEKKRWWQR